MSADGRLRVQFAHGLEGSPQGNKARALSACFDARVPAMDTSDFEACVALHATTARAFCPHVMVGSSFGGAVAVALLQRGLWRGPTLLLAAAASRYARAARLPEGVRVTLVHGLQDHVIDVADSRALARTGSPELVELIERDDDHALHAFVAEGGLIDRVRVLAGS